MKVRSFVWLVGCSCLAFCNKTVEPVTGKKEPSLVNSGYIEYLIPRNQHYATENGYKTVKKEQLRFMAVFDSSCIYTSQVRENQQDINKLYGFSDCGSGHSVNSARFGWLWNGSAIELYAYCYINGVRTSLLLDTVAIDQQNTLAIQVKAHQYIFECNGKTTAISRHCATGAIEGYQLYPYFGGDETAPHNIHIYIKEI